MQIQTIVRATFPNSDFSPGPQDNSRCEGSLSSGDDLACKWQRVFEILETAGQDLDPDVVLPPLMGVSHPIKSALVFNGVFYDLDNHIYHIRLCNCQTRRLFLEKLR
jgi:hypothetical protein